MQWVCSSLYRRYKEEGSKKPILTEDADPLEVFKECNTAVNLKRFIPFGIWLKDRPRSFHWSQTIERDFSSFGSLPFHAAANEILETRTVKG